MAIQSDLTLAVPKPLWLVVTFVSLFIIYQISVVFYNIYFHPLVKFPGPASRAGCHAVHYWHMFRGSGIRSINELHDKYGDVVRTRPDTLTFTNASAWKDIYGSHPGKEQLQKDPRFYTIGGKRDPHIVFANDADHSRMRKLLSHAFSGAALRQQEELMTRYFNLLIQRLKQSIDGPLAGEVDLTQFYNFLTFDIIGDLCFGESFDALERAEYHVWMSNVFQGIKYARVLAIAAFYEPALTILMSVVKLIPSIQKAKDEHERFATKTEKRLDTKTILRHNDNRGMTRQEIIGTSGLLIIAGSETTATLLSGVTYYLLKTPHAYQRFREEVRESFQSEGEITLTSTSRLPYLHACLEEALRLYPPVPEALPRRTRPGGDIIGGSFVPGNTSVGVAQFATYHSSKNFYKPETFAPERWLPNPPEEYRDDLRETFNPFSTGPRNCIGKNLAYNEMRSVLARLIWNFDMELCTESEEWEKQNVFFMWEKPPLKVKLLHRKFE